jgi:nitrous oxidase accessory protein
MRLFVLLVLMILVRVPLALAAEIVVPAEPGALAGALSRAQAGDVLRLSPGTHAGPITISAPLVLDGGGKAVIEGNGTGSVITVRAADVVVRGLTIRGSGSDEKDAGVNLEQTASRALVENNRLVGNLVGVNVQGARDALVRANTIEGRQDERMNDRGNGVYVWNAPGTRIIGNDIRWGRDGIFVNASKENEFSGNRFRDLRFAVHYMYAHDSVVAENVSIGNHLGYAVMFSNNVEIRGNLSRDDRNYGIMLNYTNGSRITGNRVERTAGKCVFIYNAHRNTLEGNRFEGCETGIHFTAGSERNRITGNAFINNRTQVKYVGTKWVDWSADGRGNYWSDHASFDLDGDGIADTAYRPNDIMDRVLWTQPAARALLGSPAVQLIRWSQSAFPALLPGGVIDRFPLMQPVDPEIRPWEGRQ